MTEPTSAAADNPYAADPSYPGAAEFTRIVRTFSDIAVQAGRRVSYFGRTLPVFLHGLGFEDIHNEDILLTGRGSDDQVINQYLLMLTKRNTSTNTRLYYKNRRISIIRSAAIALIQTGSHSKTRSYPKTYLV
jgi:hypothetical protein